MQEGLVRNIGALRIFRGASFSQGSTLNVSEIARETAIERKTVESTQMLDDLLLATRLPIFTKKPNVNSSNTGFITLTKLRVYRTIRPIRSFWLTRRGRGPALSLLFQSFKQPFIITILVPSFITGEELLINTRLISSSTEKKGLIGIEIEAISTIQPRSLKGLHTFQEDYPTAALHPLWRKKSAILWKNWAIPLWRGAENPLPNLLC